MSVAGVTSIALGFAFLLLLVSFRSIVIPVKAIVMNLLSVGAAYGLLVMVFQWGWGANLLDFQFGQQLVLLEPAAVFDQLAADDPGDPVFIGLAAFRAARLVERRHPGERGATTGDGDGSAHAPILPHAGELVVRTRAVPRGTTTVGGRYPVMLSTTAWASAVVVNPLMTS